MKLNSAALGLLLLALVWSPLTLGQSAESTALQGALVDDSVAGSYLASSGGGRGGGGGDGDGAPAVQPASMSATFSNFELNGISFADWSACRATSTVEGCLTTLGPGLRDQHPGGIGGDTLEFDLTVANNSGHSAVLTSFGFQSKFSESPALGSRIGDKLFRAERVGLASSAARPLVGIKKNGTSNGALGGKVKLICANSSDDYPSDLNLGTEHETLECTGGRTFDRTTNQPVLQAADGSIVTSSNVKLPKGLLPGESQTIRIALDAGTDDGALHRSHDGSPPAGGPLTGALANAGQVRAADKAVECLELTAGSGTVEEIVDFGDVKIIRDSGGTCVPSFYPFEKNQFLTVPRRNWGFTDILDTRDTYKSEELPTVLTGDTGKFSFLDFDNLREGELNFFEILRGFGEHGETLDPSCKPGGSREGTCGGSPYVPLGEFYALSGDKLVREEVVGAYGSADYSGAAPTLTAKVDTATSPNTKTTDPFETPGSPNPGTALGAEAQATFSDVVLVSDDKSTPQNEGGRAGGDKVQVTVNITNTSPTGSGIYLSSFNWQSKERGLTDINDRLDGTSIQGRQDLRTGADGTLKTCESSSEARCFDTALGIGRFPNVLGNSLLSATAISGLEVGKLEAIKKNGTFQPLMKADGKVANYICIKSGPPSEDQDADETCSGEDGKGLLPGETQSVRIELDYGDFRGLILRVDPGTLNAANSPAPDFGLLPLGGDFDCFDQRRLPYCHPDKVGQEWVSEPTTLEEIEFVTVHQPGDAPTVLDFEENFGMLLAMAGFAPTAEFRKDGVVEQVKGTYCAQPGGVTACEVGDVEPSNQPPNAVLATPSCTDLTCDFDGSGSTDDAGIVSYAWDFGGAGTATGATTATPSFTYDAAGTYTVTLTVTDAEGLTDSASTSVTVPPDDGGDPPPAENQPPAADFTSACIELVCDFTDASSDGDGSVTAWSWDFDNDGTEDSDVQHPQDVAFAAGGTYPVKLVVTDDDGATDDVTKNVVVSAAPTASFTVAGCTNFVCHFDAGSSTDDGTIVSYAWTFGDGQGGVGETVSHLYGENGVAPAVSYGPFAVTLTVTDDAGASSSTSEDVTVTNELGLPPFFDNGNAFPNGRNANTNGVQVVKWTSALTNNNYELKATVRVHVRWSVDRGATAYNPSGRVSGVVPRGSGFSPGSVKGTAPRVVASGGDWVVFEFEFTALQKQGREGAKGNAQFNVYVGTDENGDGVVDRESALGVNVHVIDPV